MEKTRIFKFFFAVYFFAVLVFVILFFHNPNGVQMNVFFNQMNSFMSDFFNVLRFNASGNPYYSEVNSGFQVYLPLVYLMYEPLSMLEDYTAVTSVQDCLSLHVGMLSCIVFMLAGVFLFFHSVITLLADSKYSILYLLLFAFSSIFIFTFERGNSYFFVIAWVVYFLKFYNSNNNYLRLFAIICLALASIFKIFPVVLALLLLKDRRYKELLVLALIGTVGTIAPFWYYGVDSVGKLLSNLQYFSSIHGNPYNMSYCFGITHLVVLAGNFLHLSTGAIDLLIGFTKIFNVVLVLLSIILAYLDKNKNRSIVLLLLLPILMPARPDFYNGVFIFPIFILFVKSDILKDKTLLIYCLFLLILSPLQLDFHGIRTYMFSSISTIIMWVLVIIESLFACIKYSNNKYLER